MFNILVRIILRYRTLNIILIGLITVFMAYRASQVKIAYEFTQMLPAKDPDQAFYQQFKQTFGEDGAVMFLGIQDPELGNLDRFSAWYDLTKDIRNLDGVQEVVSLARLYHLSKNDSTKKFEFERIIQRKPESQEELDTLLQKAYSYPIYDGLVFNKETHAHLMLITLEKEKLNSKDRLRLTNTIKKQAELFSKKYGTEVHYSGLPYIRTRTFETLRKEESFFIILAMIIASSILLLFFRSKKAVMFTTVIVAINVVWSLGLMNILGYDITILTAIVPPLLIVIVVENCIFLLNKYLYEYRLHGNKVKALTRVVQRIGSANLITNAATAAGFAAFTVTGNRVLTEFGIIASLSILIVYLLTLFLIPITFSYLPPPKERHMKHLERGSMAFLLKSIISIVQNKRNAVYIISGIFATVGIVGMLQLKTTGKVVDDISKKDQLYTDLMFLEKHFKGVMPLEIVIDTKKKRGVMKLSNIEKIDELQQELKRYPELSRSLSIAEVVKFARQAYFNGDPEYFGMPNNQELNFMVRYMPDMGGGKKNILNSFLDTNMQVARISSQMANIGTIEIEEIKSDLLPRVDSIFPPDQYETHLTGTSVVFLKGSKYLLNNLTESVLLAIVLISLLMISLFTSARMVFIALIPNLIPLIGTAGLMGYLQIPLKPSTVLVFSIALGISVDNAFQFLSRYRIYLRLYQWNIKKSVISTLSETGFSMIYSSVVLFFGFAIFVLSSFGGTQALGYLVSFTLIMGLLVNIFILPALLLTYDKKLTTRKFNEPYLEIFDEEIDIELEDLQIEQQIKSENKEIE